jgi:hypothetical protein
VSLGECRIDRVSGHPQSPAVAPDLPNQVVSDPHQSSCQDFIGYILVLGVALPRMIILGSNQWVRSSDSVLELLFSLSLAIKKHNYTMSRSAFRCKGQVGQGHSWP